MPVYLNPWPGQGIEGNNTCVCGKSSNGKRDWDREYQGEKNKNKKQHYPTSNAPQFSCVTDSLRPMEERTGSEEPSPHWPTHYLCQWFRCQSSWKNSVDICRVLGCVLKAGLQAGHLKTVWSVSGSLYPYRIQEDSGRWEVAIVQTPWALCLCNWLGDSKVQPKFSCKAIEGLQLPQAGLSRGLASRLIKK